MNGKPQAFVLVLGAKLKSTSDPYKPMCILRGASQWTHSENCVDPEMVSLSLLVYPKVHFKNYKKRLQCTLYVLAILTTRNGFWSYVLSK
jgi:hypothetical protein